MSPPATLDRAGIAARVPHHGSMCLLDRMASWSPGTIHCSTATHTDPAHPMRSSAGLLAPCAIEYAAQAMALHGALMAEASGSATRPGPGFIASVRQVRFRVERLDLVSGPLQIHARRLAGDERQVLYDFALRDAAGTELADGRAVVVLDTALPAAAQQELQDRQA